jgi:hypothetical protein
MLGNVIEYLAKNPIVKTVVYRRSPERKVSPKSSVSVAALEGALSKPPARCFILSDFS